MIRQSSCRDGQFPGIGYQIARPLQSILVRQPFAVAALFPLRAILLADGASAKLQCKHGPIFRLRVLPGYQLLALFSITQAAV